MSTFTSIFEPAAKTHVVVNANEQEFQRVKSGLHEQLVESFDLSRITRISRVRSANWPKRRWPHGAIRRRSTKSAC